MELSSSQKGGLAELKIAAEAADLGIDVYRPMIDGARCDLIFDTGASVAANPVQVCGPQRPRHQHPAAHEPA